jgi:manganese transport protein
MARNSTRIALVSLLGPAFVAGVAYLDPGNVAANITAGAQLGFLLIWVVVAGNIIAWLVQYLSASLGIVTGKSLPEVLGTRMQSRGGRLAYWFQGEVIAMATDVAEVIGGAIALNLLWGVPLWQGGLIISAVSLAVLGVHSRFGAKPFERVIVLFLVVIAVGFGVALWGEPVDSSELLAGLVPRLQGYDSLLLAAAILGATVMPHAIYAHSGFARDRIVASDNIPIERLRVATRVDVSLALVIAGSVNIALLIIGAVLLAGQPNTDTLDGAFVALQSVSGPMIATAFAVALLASSLASTAVGAYAGAEIMHGLVRRRIAPLVRRGVTVVPAIVILALGVEPTTALILSQVVLSFGIPFALIPLIVLTGNRDVMGTYRSHVVVRALAAIATALVIIINGGLIVLTLGAGG